MTKNRMRFTFAIAAALIAGLVASPALASDLKQTTTVEFDDDFAVPEIDGEVVVVPNDTLVTGPVINYLIGDWPTQSEKLTPVCRWEHSKLGSRYMMYVKIEDRRTAAQNLDMIGYVFTDGGSEERPVVFRPGVEDFVIDITGHHDDLEIGAMAASDGEGYHSNFAIMSDCSLAGPEPYNEFFG